MATAVALFSLPQQTHHAVQVTIPIEKESTDLHYSFKEKSPPRPVTEAWKKAVAPTPYLQIPDAKIQFLYDAAIRSLLLLSAEDIVPGPYTYRRFWFRDACLMLNALLAAGMTERVFNILDTFPGRQKLTGYFQSQEGEWDSNGQVLWIMDRFQQFTGHTLTKSWQDAIAKGADWIIRKRSGKETASPHAGLLPPGFSAEHLGPNDYYYWDDFWGLAGLRSAARLSGLSGISSLARRYEKEARAFERDIFRSIARIDMHRSKGGIPASPYRRMDAGAIGSMVADYPLQLTPQGDERIRITAEFLLANCFHQGAFFQDMIHSGMNIYLTLDLAQTLLRNGDHRYRELIRTVADLASSTGQWPEAIHPLTHGGCMGDGQHGWAAAEWVMMVRNLFVREEGRSLVVGSGIFPQWLVAGKPLQFGPAPTVFGSVELQFTSTNDTVSLELKIEYADHAVPPESIVIDVPGYKKIATDAKIHQKQFVLQEL